MTLKQMAILLVDPECLRELLQLPEGTEILDVRTAIDRRGVLEVKIEGAGWNTQEGASIRRTPGKITRGLADSRTIDWGMP